MIDEEFYDDHDDRSAYKGGEYSDDQALPCQFLEDVPFCLKRALEDKTRQEDGQDCVGIDFADEMRGLADDAEIGMVYSENNS